MRITGVGTGMRRRSVGAGVAAVLLLAACADQNEEQSNRQPMDVQRAYQGEGLFETSTAIGRFSPAPNPERNPYYGDLHVHTRYSFDAYLFGTMATPDDAYRFARGEPIQHPAGFETELRQPMDFYAVTDHAMFLGLAAEAGDVATVARSVHNFNEPENRGTGVFDALGRFAVMRSFMPGIVAAIYDGSITREDTLAITRSTWKDIVRAADEANVPGRFTTFVGYEYTSSRDPGNLHRNVIFRDSDRLPTVPFSRYHSQNPEGLWDWMDALRAQGVEALAIPHNSNLSNGKMFALEDWSGNPLDDAYAERRLRNEPLVEITQIKGTSETHPLLSTRDEWAEFEIVPEPARPGLATADPGNFARTALLRGLALEHRGLKNPYAFGFIGSSDSHTGASQNDESNYTSKLALLSVSPELRGSVPLGRLTAWLLSRRAANVLSEVDGEAYLHLPGMPNYGASGLAAVWAEENTRESIYAALRRKETFATSGPRLKLRFFAGDYDAGMMNAPGAITGAYARGVPMGAEMLPSKNAPSFLVWAVADPASAPLQRLQVVKGWTDASGTTHDAVFDVACARGAAPDPATNRCPDNGAHVNLTDCTFDTASGAAELKALWRDPTFDPRQRAFYYGRVLENPTCRWSTWDALRSNVPRRSDLPATIQERAWSSPIHYRPAHEP